MNEEKEVKIRRKSLLYIIITIVLVVATGTFAWLSWRTQETAMVLTIGDIRGLTVTLTPYQINGTLSPVSSYTDGIAINVTAGNQSADAENFKLFYKIETIASQLIDSGFKYTVTKCTSNCSNANNYSVLPDAGGSFASAAANSNLDIYQESVPANTTYYYKVYLWIDSAGGNQANMQNKQFTGELRASVSSSFYAVMRDNAVADNIKSKYVTNNAGIQFGSVSSDTNGKGVYLRATTANDAYPIYYYRGEVSENNVYFANYCWKIVRTTDTGGTKLVYNGETQEEFVSTTLPSSSFNVTNDGTYPFDYDSTNMIWTSTNHTDNTSSQINFGIITAGSYAINYSVSSEANYDKIFIYKNGVQLWVDSGVKTNRVILNNLTTSDTISVKYYKDNSTSRNDDNTVFSIVSKGTVTGTSCSGTGLYSQIDAQKYSNSYNSAADVGYMLGTRYPITSKNMSSITESYVYGAGYSGTYTLTNTVSFAGTDLAANKSELNNKHYTCLNTTGTCDTLYYVSYVSGNNIYYVTIPSGKTISGMFDEMLASSTNTISSNVKSVIDTWYTNNLSSYADRLEDTSWCNDRTVYQLNGWDPNGGNVSSYLYFGAYGRIQQSPYTPNLTCNTNDNFMVNGGNSKLTKPIGLLTADEARLAGGRTSTNTTYYLYTGEKWWTMTPYDYYTTAQLYIISETGVVSTAGPSSIVGIRPAISLKAGIKFASGTGTAEDPYIVE